MYTPDTREADGTRCESCERVFVPGDLMAFAVDPPGTIALCSNPPVCAECVTDWTDGPHYSWVRNLVSSFADGSDVHWVRCVAPHPRTDTRTHTRTTTKEDRT